MKDKLIKVLRNFFTVDKKPHIIITHGKEELNIYLNGEKVNETKLDTNKEWSFMFNIK